MAKKTTLTAKPERKGFYSLWRQLPGGREITMLDGKTGAPVVFSKSDIHAFNYGARNDAWRVANMLMED